MEKIFREEREKIWGKKANRERGERWERPEGGKGGKDLNRERGKQS